MFSALQRYAGVLIAPRATIRRLRPGVGASDGLVLLAFYAIGGKLEPLARGVAGFQASEGLAALLAFALSFVAFLPWVVATVLVELVLGRARAERAELTKVPLLVCVAAGGLADHLGLMVPGPVYVPEAIGVVWAVLLAAWIRPAVVVDGDEAPAPAPDDRGRAAPITLVFPVLLGLLVAANAILDLAMIRERWATMAPVGVGEPTPAFAAPLRGGGELRSDALAGDVHLLVFWTTWCGVCSAEMPTYAALHDAYAGRGLKVIAVNADAPGPERRALVDAYLQARPQPMPVALDDGSARRALRVQVFPHLVLVDRQGTIRHMHQGRVLESTLRGEIEGLLGE